MIEQVRELIQEGKEEIKRLDRLYLSHRINRTAYLAALKFQYGKEEGIRETYQLLKEWVMVTN